MAKKAQNGVARRAPRKQASTTGRARRIARPPKAEWGVVLERAAGYMDVNGQPCRPWVALWVDLSGERDLAMEMSGDRAGAITARGYERALDCAGAAPARVLVRDQAVAAALRGAVPAEIPIALDRRSRLTAIAESMAEAAAGEAAASESLLTSRRVADALKVDFAAAASEWLVWNQRWPLEGGFLVVEPCPDARYGESLPVTVAGLGPQASLLLLDGVADLEAATRWDPGEPPPTIQHGEIHMQHRDEMASSDWKELSRRGLCLPGDQVADAIFTDSDHIIRPLTELDARRAIASLRACTAWLARDAVEPDMDELILPLEAGGATYRVRIGALEDEPGSDPAALGLVREPDGMVYQLRITIEGSRPPIWRRVRVPGAITLCGLHEVIQRAMGWENYHLHQFDVGDRSFAPAGEEPEFGPAPEDEALVRLDALVAARSRFTYTYDFGDDWVHHIEVESVSPFDPEVRLTECTGGERACPPEDSGGIHGYYDLLARARGRGRAAREAREWLGDHDPDRFVLAEVNADLDDLS